jgi:hypothetical protein
MNDVQGTDSPAILAYRHRLDHLGLEGMQLRAMLLATPDDAHGLQALGIWQRECANTVSQLSGGVKAHWLSRSFSEALLVPSSHGASASVVTIIDRLLSVIDAARQSLSNAVETSDGTAAPPPPRPRFTFVENVTLRSNLEAAYRDGQAALANGDFELALTTLSSVLETVITHALERRGIEALASHEPPPGTIVDFPFSSRIAVAERAGLISRACARLPEAARSYRDHATAEGDLIPASSVSARDAKLTSDVLHIILRDLAPGR